MRLLLIGATTGYQTRVFSAAAERLGYDLVLATDRCHVLDDPWGDRAIALRFEDPPGAAATLASERGVDGIVALGDRPAYIAALAAERMGILYNSPDSVAASRNKFLARERFRAAGLLVPQFHRIPLSAGPQSAPQQAPYPCVLKPLGLSASRGVIRANNAAEFLAAFERIRKMGEACLQVESYIPGREFAVEGLVTAGHFQPIAIFDKPDPLEGPFFEETIYVTPSREPADVQRKLLETTARAVLALGLKHGPIHAELRHNTEGAWMLET